MQHVIEPKECERFKAEVKYEIKTLEAKLTYYLSTEIICSSHVKMSINLCSLIRQRYEDYLRLIEPFEQFISYTYDSCQPTASTWHDFCLQIERIKTRRDHGLTRPDEINLVKSLSFYYQQLRILLVHYEQTPQFNVQDGVETQALKPLLQASTPQDWLNGLVIFVNQQAGVNKNDCFLQLSSLNNVQLIHLSKAFNHPDYIQLINAIFFCKLQPHKLFPRNVHPEKLVSVKNRLSFLYDVVELLQLLLMQILAQRGFATVHDYLFHNEELPQGIEVEIDETCRALILSAIKTSNLYASSIDPNQAKHQFQEVFRAYKFWFNPNRLIDSVMVLKQNYPNEEELNPLGDAFYRHIRSQYRQLSTMECLDLYGYFANKDTKYLMQTLFVAQRGELLTWLPALNRIERDAIEQVYGALDCVMQSLRDELSERHIATKPYQYVRKKSQLSPGRRNLNAMFRIISLYAREEMRSQTTIESLFQKLGS